MLFAYLKNEHGDADHIRAWSRLTTTVLRVWNDVDHGKAFWDLDNINRPKTKWRANRLSTTYLRLYPAEHESSEFRNFGKLPSYG